MLPLTIKKNHNQPKLTSKARFFLHTVDLRAEDELCVVCISSIHCMAHLVLFSHYALAAQTSLVCVSDFSTKFCPEKMFSFSQAKFDHISYIMETLLSVLSQQSMRISVELLALEGVNI